MPRPTHLLTWLMLAMLVGGHWGVLQVVGWASMLIEYSRDATFAEAWEKTFSGEHPCAICKTVDQGLVADLVDDERKAELKVIKTVKLDAVVGTVEVINIPSFTEELPAVHQLAVPAGMAMEPPRRPPRVMG